MLFGRRGCDGDDRNGGGRDSGLVVGFGGNATSDGWLMTTMGKAAMLGGACVGVFVGKRLLHKRGFRLSDFAKIEWRATPTPIADCLVI